MDIEITDTSTAQPKLTIARDRVALKFHRDMPHPAREPFIGYAKKIAILIGTPEHTFRGKFHKDGFICLKNSNQTRRFTLTEL